MHSYVNDTCCVGDRPSIKQLVKVMRMEDIGISTHWRDLGLELVDNNEILQVIEANNPGDVNIRCRVMFEKWLEMKPNASWNQLIIALKAIKMNTAAYAISKLFKSGYYIICIYTYVSDVRTYICILCM